MKERTTVLLVDDDPATLHVLPTHLSELADVDVVSARDGREAIELMRHQRFHLVVTRLELTAVDGLTVLAAARQRDPRMNVVVLTSLGAKESAERMVRLGGIRLLRTPCPASAVAAAVRDALGTAGAGPTAGVHLPAVAQLVAHVARSCTIEVVTPERRGRLHFDSGRLVDAVADGGLTGERAAIEVFGWPEVRFAFGRAEHDVPDRIRATLEDLLLAAALIDERAPAPQQGEGAAPGAAPQAASHAAPTVRPPIAERRRESPDGERHPGSRDRGDGARGDGARGDGARGDGARGDAPAPRPTPAPAPPLRPAATAGPAAARTAAAPTPAARPRPSEERLRRPAPPSGPGPAVAELDAAIARLSERLHAAERELAGIASELAALHEVRRQIEQVEARHERARQDLARFRSDVERAARALLERVDGLFADDGDGGAVAPQPAAARLAPAAATGGAPAPR